MSINASGSILRRCNRLATCIFALVMLACPSSFSEPSHDLWVIVRQIGKIPCVAVAVDTAGTDVKISAGVPAGGLGSKEEFQSFIGRLDPAAAVTGAFYCTKTKMPIGQIVIDGKAVNSGCVGSCFCVSKDGRPDIMRPRDLKGQGVDGYQTVLGGGILLPMDGTADRSARAQGFKDSQVFRRALRAAVGVMEDGTVLFVNTRARCSLGDLDRVMKALDCKEAMCLDGGSGIALYCRGQFYNNRHARITNVLLVYR